MKIPKSIKRGTEIRVYWVDPAGDVSEKPSNARFPLVKTLCMFYGVEKHRGRDWLVLVQNEIDGMPSTKYDGVHSIPMSSVDKMERVK